MPTTFGGEPIIYKKRYWLVKLPVSLFYSKKVFK
ncbi:hypothetical protein [Staphylococcus aureus]